MKADYKKQMNNKQKRLRYLCQYGFEVLHTLLVKDGYTHYSHRPKSIPKEGSIIHEILDKFVPQAHEVFKVIIHKGVNPNITLKTKVGYVQYLKLNN